MSDESSKEERVRHIAELMTADQWPPFPETAAFRRKLAAEWDVSEHTVRGYAAEAHRRVALDPEERARLQEDLGRRLLSIAEEARASRNVITNLPDFPSAIRATETAAKFLGIEFETKVKLSGTVTLDDLDELRKRVDAAGE